MKTVYVQHDDASDDQGVSVIDELMSSPQIATAGIPVDAAITALKDIMFTDAMLQSPRSALSGGWKMKLLIVKAMLVEPDVLLLDEPTNHLDADSVQWLVDYLQSLTDVTCMIVSHDTAFMDKVCGFDFLIGLLPFDNFITCNSYFPKLSSIVSSPFLTCLSLNLTVPGFD